MTTTSASPSGAPHMLPHTNRAVPRVGSGGVHQPLGGAQSAGTVQMSGPQLSPPS